MLKVKQYDLQRSSDLLKNLTLVSNKREIIKQAFLSCPYNPDVYKAVMDNSMTDVATFETAQYLLQSELLTPFIAAFCKANTANYQTVVIPVKVLALYTGKDEKSFYLSLYGEKIGDVYKKYEELKGAATGKDGLIKLIEERITSDAIDFCNMSDEMIRSRVCDIVKGQAAENNPTPKYIEWGILRLEDISMTDTVPESLDEVDGQYIVSILSQINMYLPTLKEHVQSCESEAKELKHQYDSAYAEYSKELTALTSSLDILKGQRQSLAVVAFGKKKRTRF